MTKLIFCSVLFLFFISCKNSPQPNILGSWELYKIKASNYEIKPDSNEFQRFTIRQNGVIEDTCRQCFPERNSPRIIKYELVDGNDLQNKSCKLFIRKTQMFNRTLMIDTEKIVLDSLAQNKMIIVQEYKRPYGNQFSKNERPEGYFFYKRK